jgi:hypothetical protein
VHAKNDTENVHLRRTHVGATPKFCVAANLARINRLFCNNASDSIIETVRSVKATLSLTKRSGGSKHVNQPLGRKWNAIYLFENRPLNIKAHFLAFQNARH